MIATHNEIGWDEECAFIDGLTLVDQICSIRKGLALRSA